jgi:hypothetical protein
MHRSSGLELRRYVRVVVVGTCLAPWCVVDNAYELGVRSAAHALIGQVRSVVSYVIDHVVLAGRVVAVILEVVLVPVVGGVNLDVEGVSDPDAPCDDDAFRAMRFSDLLVTVEALVRRSCRSNAVVLWMN